MRTGSEPTTALPTTPRAGSAQHVPARRGAMGSALFRTVREGLGLSAPAAAQLLGTAPRQIEMWERSLPPVSAVQFLLRLQRTLDWLVQAAVDAHEARFAAAEEPPAAVLVRYATAACYAASADGRSGLPFALHGAMIARVRADLIRLGAEVAVVWDHEVERTASHLAARRLH